VPAIGVAVAPRRMRAQRGASMLAAGIGVFVLGVAVAIAVPLAQQSIRQARAAEVVEELRDFAGAFQAFARQRGDWPPASSAVGQVPAGMETTLGEKWTHRTPIGGRYLWAPDSLQRGRRYRATIMLYPVARQPLSDDPRLLEEIDRQIDDGNLHSGNFQLGHRDRPFFVIEP